MTGSRLLLLASILVLPVTASATDWPYFRGPDLNGVSEESGWNPKNLKVAWSKEIGVGAASFVVSGNKVITSANKDDTDIVYCFNADDGNELWRYEYPCKFDKRMFDGGTAATPTIDGEFVYNLSYEGQLQCLKLADGKEVWKTNVMSEYGGKLSRWKYAGSPLAYGKLLIVDVGGSPNSTLALDKRTGKKVWGVGSEGAGYASPMSFKQGSINGVMVFKAKSLVAYNATNGKELWRIPFQTQYDVNASTPIVLGKYFFVSAGYKTGRGALYQLTNDVPKEVWTSTDMQTKMSTCVVHEGHVYGISAKVGLTCIDLKTGTTKWQDASTSKEGTLMLADGKLIILSDRGELIIADANSTGFKPIVKQQVLQGRCWVMPVLANGRIYCKTNQGKTVCLDVR